MEIYQILSQGSKRICCQIDRTFGLCSGAKDIQNLPLNL